MYEHFLRADANGYVIHGFCDVFEAPMEGDISLGKTKLRQFTMMLIDPEGVPMYMVDAQGVRGVTETERQTYINGLPVSPPSLEERVEGLEEAILSLA